MKRTEKTSLRLPITWVELKVPPRIQISSNNLETTFLIGIRYGDKKYQQKGKKFSQNGYLFLDMDIVTILQLNMSKDQVVYSLQQCDVYVRSRETNQDVSWLKDLARVFMDKWRGGNNSYQQRRRQNGNTNLELLKKKLCGIVRRIIGIMNENWKDNFVIDPLGEMKLLLKPPVQVNDNCMELNMNLGVRGAEVSSKQNHEAFSGSGISILTDYIYTMMMAGNYSSELNKKLEETNLELSPDELQGILPEVHESDTTKLTVIIEEMPRLQVTAENRTVTVKAKLEGYVTKSEKSAFEVMFDTNMKIKLVRDNNKMMLQFLSCGDPVVHDWQSSIGHSGDLELKNLQVLIKKLSCGIILSALTDLHLSFVIPCSNMLSKVDGKQGSVHISPTES